MTPNTFKTSTCVFGKTFDANFMDFLAQLAPKPGGPYFSPGEPTSKPLASHNSYICLYTNTCVCVFDYICLKD